MSVEGQTEATDAQPQDVVVAPGETVPALPASPYQSLIQRVEDYDSITHTVVTHFNASSQFCENEAKLIVNFWEHVPQDFYKAVDDSPFFIKRRSVDDNTVGFTLARDE